MTAHASFNKSLDLNQTLNKNDTKIIPSLSFEKLGYDKKQCDAQKHLFIIEIALA